MSLAGEIDRARIDTVDGNICRERQCHEGVCTKRQTGRRRRVRRKYRSRFATDRIVIGRAVWRECQRLEVQIIVTAIEQFRVIIKLTHHQFYLPGKAGRINAVAEGQNVGIDAHHQPVGRRVDREVHDVGAAGRNGAVGGRHGCPRLGVRDAPVHGHDITIYQGISLRRGREGPAHRPAKRDGAVRSNQQGADADG